MVCHSPAPTWTSVSYLQRQTESDSDRHLIEESLSWQEGALRQTAQSTGWRAEGLPENLPSHPQPSNPPEGTSWCVFVPADDSSRWAAGVCVHLCVCVWECVVKIRPADYIQAWATCSQAGRWSDSMQQAQWGDTLERFILVMSMFMVLAWVFSHRYYFTCRRREKPHPYNSNSRSMLSVYCVFNLICNSVLPDIFVICQIP